MLADVTVERGQESFKYRLYMCFSPMFGIWKEDLGVKEVRYSHAVVYHKDIWRVFLAPSKSIAQARFKDLNRKSRQPRLCRIKKESF